MGAAAGADDRRPERTIGLDALRKICAAHGLSLPQGARVSVDCGVMPLGLVKNCRAVSPAGQARLLAACVLVVGAGGLGGYVVELLARLGLGRIKIADGDVFEESNLNRQLLATPLTLGRNKAAVGAARLREICPCAVAEPLECHLDETSLPRALADVHLVVDALGGLAPRKMLHAVALDAGVPVVSAAVAGWTALVGSETPAKRGISRLWSGPLDRDAERVLGSLAPVASFAAAAQAAEAARYFLEGTLPLAGKMLHADLASFHCTVYDF